MPNYPKIDKTDRITAKSKNNNALNTAKIKETDFLGFTTNVSQAKDTFTWTEYTAFSDNMNKTQSNSTNNMQQKETTNKNNWPAIPAPKSIDSTKDKSNLPNDEIFGSFVSAFDSNKLDDTTSINGGKAKVLTKTKKKNLDPFHDLLTFE